MKLFSIMALAATSIITCATFGADVVIPEEVKVRHVANCPEFEGEAGEFLTKQVFKLPGSEFSPAPRTLFILGCELYAYNSLERAYIVTPYGEIKDVAVAEVSHDGAITATSWLMGAGFDEATLTLGTFQKGRGMGDCGSSAEYKYDASAENFILEEARSKNECDGEFEEEWPVVYKR